jgi:chromosome segregation ATPase
MEQMQTKVLQKQALISRKEEMLAQKLKEVESREDESRSRLAKLRQDEERRENTVLQLQLQEEDMERRTAQLQGLEHKIEQRETEIERVEALLSQHSHLLVPTGSLSVSGTGKHATVSYLLQELSSRLAEADVARQLADDTRLKCTEQTQQLHEKDAEREEHWRKMIGQCEIESQGVAQVRADAEDSRAQAQALSQEWERRIAEADAKTSEVSAKLVRQQKTNDGTLARLQEREQAHEMAAAQFERDRRGAKDEAKVVSQQWQEVQNTLADVAGREAQLALARSDVEKRLEALEARERCVASRFHRRYFRTPRDY